MQATQHSDLLINRLKTKKWIPDQKDQTELQTIQKNQITQENLMNSLFVSVDKPQILEMLQSQITTILKNDPNDFLFGTSNEDPVAVIDINNPIQDNINEAFPRPLQDNLSSSVSSVQLLKETSDPLCNDVENHDKCPTIETTINTLDDLEMVNVAFDGCLQ